MRGMAKDKSLLFLAINELESLIVTLQGNTHASITADSCQVRCLADGYRSVSKGWVLVMPLWDDVHTAGIDKTRMAPATFRRGASAVVGRWCPRVDTA